LKSFLGRLGKSPLFKAFWKTRKSKPMFIMGGEGTMAPWDSGGGLPINRIMVSGEDYGKAMEVVKQYCESMKKQEPPDITVNDGLAEDPTG